MRQHIKSVDVNLHSTGVLRAISEASDGCRKLVVEARTWGGEEKIREIKRECRGNGGESRNEDRIRRYDELELELDRMEY